MFTEGGTKWPFSDRDLTTVQPVRDPERLMRFQEGSMGSVATHTDEEQGDEKNDVQFENA